MLHFHHKFCMIFHEELKSHRLPFVRLDGSMTHDARVHAQQSFAGHPHIQASSWGLGRRGTRNVGTSLVLNVEVKLGLPVLLKTHRIDMNSVSHTPIRIACKIQSVLPFASMSCFVFLFSPRSPLQQWRIGKKNHTEIAKWMTFHLKPIKNLAWSSTSQVMLCSLKAAGTGGVLPEKNVQKNGNSW